MTQHGRVCSLVKWEREQRRAGSKDLLEVLEKVCRELQQYDRYKDDRRYLRMWVLYVRFSLLSPPHFTNCQLLSPSR